MMTVKVGILVVGFAGLAPAATAEVFIEISMDQQINLGAGDAIYASGGIVEFPSDGQDGWTRRHMTASGWYDLNLDLTLAGEGEVDVSGTTNTLEFDCRYFQDNANPYADAPIFVEIGSANGHARSFGIVYQTGGGWVCDPIDRFPDWFHVTIDVNDLAGDYNCDGTPDVSQGAEFDPTRVTRIRFYGTDWNYTAGSTDWIDVKDLRIVAAGQNLPPAPYAVTPVLFVPDPASYPAGYAPTQAEIDEDLANITAAMQRIRRWYGQALGLTDSMRVNPTVYMPANGGLGDYDITWNDPERRYDDGIGIGNTWGLVLDEVSARGHGPGTAVTPLMTVLFCKGAGGFAGGAQWHSANGGGMCMLGDWCLDSMAERVPPEWWTWWTGVDRQVGAAGHEMGHTIGLPHPDPLNPVTGEQDYPYTIMGAWWDWPDYPVNPADPMWPLVGLHAWSDNSASATVTGYQDQFLLDYRMTWFAHPLADLDSDGDVDLQDYASFQACYGQSAPYTAGCEATDLDYTESTDFDDYAVFAANLTGPA